MPVAARYSAPVQTGPGANTASYTIGTGSISGVKRPGRDVHQPSPFSAEVKERVWLNLYYYFGPSWPVLGGTLPFPLPYSLSFLEKRVESKQSSSRSIVSQPL